ncbi:MAG TPA: hypothetical protein DCQ64_18630 [Candidatus Rokubacteria bacterium]|nr:hypothetical protein [Candidatus Rokubacteria bacterium]
MIRSTPSEGKYWTIVPTTGAPDSAEAFNFRVPSSVSQRSLSRRRFRARRRKIGETLLMLLVTNSPPRAARIGWISCV